MLVREASHWFQGACSQPAAVIAAARAPAAAVLALRRRMPATKPGCATIPVKRDETDVRVPPAVTVIDFTMPRGATGGRCAATARVKLPSSHALGCNVRHISARHAALGHDRPRTCFAR
jgi:hypothetical protein